MLLRTAAESELRSSDVVQWRCVTISRTSGIYSTAVDYYTNNNEVVKIDLSNSCNCIRRDSVFAAVSVSIPEIYRFLYASLFTEV